MTGTFYKYKINVYAASLGDEYIAEGLVFAKSYADAVAKLEHDYTFHNATGKHDMEIAEILHIEAYFDAAGERTDIYETVGYNAKFKELREKGEI